MRSTRFCAAAALTLVTATALGACGGKSDGKSGPASDVTFSAEPSPTATSSSPAASPSPSATTNAQIIKVTIGENSVNPRGTRIKVKKNVPVIFEITAVKAGSLHAHSSPGQELEYPKGSSSGKLVFDQPGIIAVEDHRLDKLVVQLEVR